MMMLLCNGKYKFKFTKYNLNLKIVAVICPIYGKRKRKL